MNLGMDIAQMGELSTPWFILGVVILLMLIAASALVSGSEVAFFSLSPTDKQTLHSEGGKANERALMLLDRPHGLLATILILNNFINIGIVLLASFLLQPILGQAQMDPLVRLLVEVVGITFVILLCGEVIPKVYATQKGLTLVRFMASPLSVFYKLPPFSLLREMLVSGTSFIHRKFQGQSMNLSSEELEHALDVTSDQESPHSEHSIMEGVVRIGQTEASNVMTSRMDIDAVNLDMPFDILLDFVQEKGRSRLPVYSESRDDIKGVLYIKDLVPFLDKDKDYNWHELIRPPFVIPENTKLDDLLNQFQEKKVHLALVVDEYGGVSGLITLEDVMEEVVGDISDEFDEDDLSFSRIDENTYLIEGKTPLVDVYRILKIDGKEFEQAKGEAESLAGFLIEQAGKILRKHEKLRFSNFTLQVEAADKRRIRQVKVIRDEQ